MGEEGREKRYWFGPKRTFGWGWTPITWEGWLATGAVVVGVVVASVAVRGTALVVVSLGLVAGLILLAVLKGTAPGGSF